MSSTLFSLVWTAVIGNILPGRHIFL